MNFESNENPKNESMSGNHHKTHHSLQIVIVLMTIIIIFSISFYLIRKNNNQFDNIVSNNLEMSSNENSSTTDIITIDKENFFSSVDEKMQYLIPIDSKYQYSYNELYFVEEGNYTKVEVDLNTFEYINEDYVKDTNSVFYKGKLVNGINPAKCSKQNISACRYDLQNAGIAPYVLDVNWNETKVSVTDLIKPQFCTTEGYDVGIVENGVFAGSHLFAQSEEICDMYCGGFYERNVFHYLSFNNNLIPIDEQTGLKINGIYDFPKEVSIPNSDLKLKTLGTAGFLESDISKARFLFTDAKAGSIYDEGSGNYYGVRSDKIRMEYALEFPFYTDKESSVLNITFLDGSKNSEAYTTGSYYGQVYSFVEEENFDRRLIKIGEFSNGNEIYKLANDSDKLLTDLYSNGNTLASYADGKNKYTYYEFINHKPYLYWRNPFGDWVIFLNKRYETAAEKCKPVIYLYPEKTGDFEVYVEPNGGFTQTIPEYGTGWKVKSTSQSLITDKKTGLTYPYLYWEGINTGIPEITEGWVVSKNNIESFLIEKLSVLGLNKNEIEDFNEYWIDRIQKSEASDFKIMFLPQAQFDQVSPLKVVGDEITKNTIRVMMYVQPAENGEELPLQILPETPDRSGFTVVEWGGAFLN